MSMTTRIVLVTAAIGLAASLASASGKPKSAEKHFGAAVDATAPATPIADILSKPAAFEGKPVVVEGRVSSVCQKKGCWMFVTDGRHDIRVDFKDYGFFVPRHSEGKKVRLEGTVRERLVERDVARHWAEEQKNPPVKPEDIHGDVKMVILTAAGVVMRDGGEFPPEQLDAIGGKPAANP